MIRVVNAPSRCDELIAQLGSKWILPRIWAHDYRVWKPDPTEITNRLGWLHLPFSMTRELDRLGDLLSDVPESRFEHVLLLGMGGSSLAAETFARTFGPAPGHPSLIVLDSTHPAAIVEVERRIDLARTLFLVATKSGTTTETLSLYRYFRHRMEGVADDPGAQFVAITDPGSPLVELAKRHGFRETFLNNPNIGGRYSALSLFGLVPAALLGLDVEELLRRAQSASVEFSKYESLAENPAVLLGAILGACAKDGRDKATLHLPSEIATFADWIEQLIAESTGKEGIGILPIVGEPLASPDAYAEDRLFVSFSLGRGGADRDELLALERAGHPVIHVVLKDLHSLGDQFFLWELATAIAGHILGINPFDQPNVETAKAFTREAIDAYRRDGKLPQSGPPPLTSHEQLTAALAGIEPRSYIALQAYVPPTGSLTDAFTALRSALRDRFGVATTCGYGPRFLHSTGQLHKGDGGCGRFIQLVSDASEDVPIPTAPDRPSSTLTFGTLISAQAQGDRQALLDAGRSVTTFVVPADPTDSIRRIAADMSRERS